MDDGFFSDVARRSRSGASTRPIRSATRSTSRTGWSSASGWRTTSGRASASGTRSRGPARTCSASGTLDRPWLTRDRRPDGRRAPEDGRRLRVLHQARRAVLLLPRPRRRARRASFAEFRSNLDALADDAAGYQERTGVRLLWGTANLFTHPRYQAGAATNPDPEVFAYAAAQVKHMLEVTQRLGGENYVLWGGREGYDTLLNTDLAPRGRPARAVPAPGRRAQAQDRVQRPAAHRAQADGADQAPVRLRRRDGPRLPRPPRARGRVPASTSRRTTRRWPGTASTTRSRSPSPTGCSAASTRTAATRRTAGTPTSSRTRSRTWRCRSTRSCAHGGIAPGGFNFDAKLRRQSTDRTDLFHAHIGGAGHARPGPAGRRRPGRARRARASCSRGALRGLGRRARAPRSWAASATLETLERERRRRRASTRGRVSGHQELLENLVNQRDLGDRSGRVTTAPPLTDGLRHRHRRLDDRDQGRPDRRGRRGARRRRRRVRLRRPAAALERAGPGALVGRHGRRDPVGPGHDRRRRRRRSSPSG